MSELTLTLQGRAKPRFTVPFAVVEPLFALFDAAAITGASFLATAVSVYLPGGATGIGLSFIGLAVISGLLYGLMGHFVGLYRFHALISRERSYRRVLAVWSVALLLGLLAVALFRPLALSTQNIIATFPVLASACLLLTRHLGRSWLRISLAAGAIRGRRAVIVGTQAELSQFARPDMLVSFGLDEVDRVVLSRSDKGSLAPALATIDFDAVTRRIRDLAADEVILALPWQQHQDIEAVLEKLRVVPLSVQLLPDRSVSSVLQRQNKRLPGQYMVELQAAPLSMMDCAAKRAADIVMAAVGLIVLSPILAMAALAVKVESKGPVVFCQRRQGFNGRAFVIYKFRSMTVAEDGASVVQASRNDARVTRVGRILRHSSIDELPQLVNVLLGQMSIVGPRPHALAHDHEYGQMIANYAFRHHMKPGITGWAQVNGLRGGTPQLALMEQRIELDLWYINNWSFVLDIWIIAKTCFALIRPHNAY